jgi:hypothetical protein
MESDGEAMVLVPMRSVRLTMLLVGAIFWIGIPFIYRSPSDFFPCLGIFAIGLFFWQLIGSIRIVLDDKRLEYRQLGFVRWQLPLEDVLIREGRRGAYGGFPAVLVYARNSEKLVGTISRMQFGADDIKRFKSKLQSA